MPSHHLTLHLQGQGVPQSVQVGSILFTLRSLLVTPFLLTTSRGGLKQRAGFLIMYIAEFLPLVFKPSIGRLYYGSFKFSYSNSYTLRQVLHYSASSSSSDDPPSSLPKKLDFSKINFPHKDGEKSPESQHSEFKDATTQSSQMKPPETTASKKLDMSALQFDDIEYQGTMFRPRLGDQTFASFGAGRTFQRATALGQSKNRLRDRVSLRVDASLDPNIISFSSSKSSLGFSNSLESLRDEQTGALLDPPSKGTPKDILQTDMRDLIKYPSSPPWTEVRFAPTFRSPRPSLLRTPNENKTRDILKSLDLDKDATSFLKSDLFGAGTVDFSKEKNQRQDHPAPKKNTPYLRSPRQSAAPRDFPKSMSIAGDIDTSLFGTVKGSKFDPGSKKEDWQVDRWNITNIKEPKAQYRASKWKQEGQAEEFDTNELKPLGRTRDKFRAGTDIRKGEPAMKQKRVWRYDEQKDSVWNQSQSQQKIDQDDGKQDIELAPKHVEELLPKHQEVSANKFNYELLKYPFLKDDLIMSNKRRRSKAYRLMKKFKLDKAGMDQKSIMFKVLAMQYNLHVQHTKSKYVGGESKRAIESMPAEHWAKNHLNMMMNAINRNGSLNSHVKEKVLFKSMETLGKLSKIVSSRASSN